MTRVKGNLVNEVQKLKNENGKDIIVWGGSFFVSDLVKKNLIGEFHLFVNPVALGKGLSIFNEIDNWQHLKLCKSITCDGGIVIQHYDILK